MNRYSTFLKACLFCSSMVLGTLNASPESFRSGVGTAPWERHTIDNSLQGADGVRLADINGDQRLDIVSGWEETGVTRVYLQPEPSRVRHPWPSVSIGSTPSVEDAVFVDLDGNGRLDVVSSTEGTEKAIYLHWLNGDPLLPRNWTRKVLPASDQLMQWMYSLPVDLLQDGKPELVAGGKQENAWIGWFEVGPRERLDLWQWHPLRKAGWIMSLLEADMNDDGHPDVVFTDRRGDRSGAFWLENPASRHSIQSDWTEHYIGAGGEEIMFAALADLDLDGRLDLVAAVKPQRILYFRRKTVGLEEWNTYSVAMPSSAGTAKAVEVGDIDLDGKPDLVFSCEHASSPLSGVMWMSYRDFPTASEWDAFDISGPQGTKFDLVKLIDLDRDGDLDVLTCEETDGLGIVWYENPVR